jgi:hypothetical protein
MCGGGVAVSHPSYGSPKEHAFLQGLNARFPILLTPTLTPIRFDAPTDATWPHWHYWHGFWTRW